MTTKIERLLDNLESLGSPNAIAEFLRLQGCRGRRGDAFKCPVATYITQNTGAQQLLISKPLWTTIAETGITPPTVGQFVAMFDGGDYPDLVVP